MRRLALILVLVPALAIAGERDGPLPDTLPLQLLRADGGWVSPRVLVIGGQAFALPGEARVTDHNRLDLGGIPLLGDLTGRVLGADDFSTRVPVGTLRLSAEAVVIELTAPGLAELPVSVMADLPRLGRVEFDLARNRPLGPATQAPVGAPDGGVYLIEGRGGRRLVAVAGEIGRYLLE